LYLAPFDEENAVRSGSQSQFFTWIIWIAAGAAGLTGLAIAVNVATGSSLDQWSTTASIVSGAVGVLGVLGAAFSAFFALRTTDAKDKANHAQEELAFKLISTFANIEKEATLGYQQKIQAESPRPLSLREVRRIMADSAVWDDQDQIDFDLATRTRNAIVHGDLDEVDPGDLRSANEKAQQLLKKVHEAGAADA
jgi:hypothetical protein